MQICLYTSDAFIADHRLFLGSLPKPSMELCIVSVNPRKGDRCFSGTTDFDVDSFDLVLEEGVQVKCTSYTEHLLQVEHAGSRTR